MLTIRQKTLKDERRQSVARVIASVLEATNGRTSSHDIEAISTHPLSVMVYRLAAREGALARAKIEAVIALLLTRLKHDSRRLRESGIVAIQSPAVLPEKDTRNLILCPEDVEEAGIEERLDRLATSVADALPDWWKEFTAITRSYTEVTVNGMLAPPGFSGTFSDAPGAIHGPKIDRQVQFVETLTHESGHMWLNLLAENSAGFIGNPYSEARYLSPWRSDLRPIHGILHGVYVFSIVVPALMSLRDPAASARAAELVIEVQDGVLQLEAFGEFSGEASDIVRNASQRIRLMRQKIESSALHFAQERYQVAKERKMRNLSRQQLYLRVA